MDSFLPLPRWSSSETRYRTLNITTAVQHVNNDAYGIHSKDVTGHSVQSVGNGTEELISLNKPNDYAVLDALLVFFVLATLVRYKLRHHGHHAGPVWSLVHTWMVLAPGYMLCQAQAAFHQRGLYIQGLNINQQNHNRFLPLGQHATSALDQSFSINRATDQVATAPTRDQRYGSSSSSIPSHSQPQQAVSAWRDQKKKKKNKKNKQDHLLCPFEVLNGPDGCPRQRGSFRGFRTIADLHCHLNKAHRLLFCPKCFEVESINSRAQWHEHHYRACDAHTEIDCKQDACQLRLTPDQECDREPAQSKPDFETDWPGGHDSRLNYKHMAKWVGLVHGNKDKLSARARWLELFSFIFPNEPIDGINHLWEDSEKAVAGPSAASHPHGGEVSQVSGFPAVAYTASSHTIHPHQPSQHFTDEQFDFRHGLAWSQSVNESVTSRSAPLVNDMRCFESQIPTASCPSWSSNLGFDFSQATASSSHQAPSNAESDFLASTIFSGQSAMSTSPTRMSMHATKKIKSAPGLMHNNQWQVTPEKAPAMANSASFTGATLFQPQQLPQQQYHHNRGYLDQTAAVDVVQDLEQDTDANMIDDLQDHTACNSPNYMHTNADLRREVDHSGGRFAEQPHPLPAAAHSRGKGRAQPSLSLFLAVPSGSSEQIMLPPITASDRLREFFLRFVHEHIHSQRLSRYPDADMLGKMPQSDILAEGVNWLHEASHESLVRDLLWEHRQFLRARGQLR